MRIHKTYNIDIELDKKIKERGINASELINELLRGYFNKQELNNLSSEEIKKRLAIIKLKKEYEERRLELEDGL
jgi:metal-responsive CopG/Arc/MetJ family transcriptional regulator